MASALADLESQAKAALERRDSTESKGSKTSRKSERTKADFHRSVDFVKDLKFIQDDSPTIQKLREACQYAAKPLIIMGMTYVWAAKQTYKIYKTLPMNTLNIIFGLGLCFFGGVYFTAIAAVEAARNMGGIDICEHLSVCWNEANEIAEASKKDDEVDANGNNIPDVEEMSPNQLINHKARIALMAVKDPQRLQKACLALLQVYVAVIATLKYQFAKTLAIAMGIAEMLSLTITRLTAPTVCSVLGPDLNHWVPTIIDTVVKFLAVVIATYIQAVLSALYSGLRGGRMVAVAFFNIATEQGWMEQLPDEIVPKPFDPDKSYLDEAIQYPLAILGFYLQLTRGFTLDFPFNLVLLPLTIIEWFLRFQVYT